MVRSSGFSDNHENKTKNKIHKFVAEQKLTRPIQIIQKCKANRLPEEDKDGFPIRSSIQLLIVVEVWLYPVNQAWVHFIHLIKDEHGALTVGHVASNPLL